MGGGDTEVLLTMLKSRRIQDKIIASHQLTMSDSKELTLDEARELLTEVTLVSLGRKDGVITVCKK